MDIIALLRKDKIIPVVIIEDAAWALPLAEAIMESGLHNIEITLRTAAGPGAIRRIAAADGLCVGAGTVLSVDQVKEARDAGAHFIVSPGSNPTVLDYCLENDIPIFPGVCTPTEIEMVRSLGITTLKFFPAEAAGGIAFLKAIAAPYGNLRFIPTGGINDANLETYLKVPSVLSCGSSWMVAPNLLVSKDWSEVRRRCQTLIKITTGQGANE